jgi:hypothetical protein
LVQSIGGRLNPPFQTVVNRQFQTTAGVFLSYTNFTYNNLLGDLSSSARLCKLKSVVVEMAPLYVGSSGSYQNISIQLRGFDPRSTNYCPMTDLITLSNVNPTRVRCSFPSDMMGWFATTSSTVAFEVGFYNTDGGGASALQVYLTVSCNWVLSRDTSSFV